MNSVVFTSAQQFSGLKSLSLSDDDLRQLSRQGVLRQETRRGKTIWKLRYRSDGRQRVKYVRGEHVVQIRTELDSLQASTRLRRELNRYTRAALAHIKKGKAELMSLAENSGFRFHGYAIRRSRTSRKTSINQ